MTAAYLNRLATAVPPHDVHAAFVDFAEDLIRTPRERLLFRRMVERGGIEHRWSPLAPAAPDVAAPQRNRRSVDSDGFYSRGDFPTTGQRMRLYETAAPELAAAAAERLQLDPQRPVSHLIVTSCTGFMAPGLDLEIQRRLNLPAEVERTVIGFMGCYAAMNALKLARHIVRSDPAAQVLVVAVELCSLHLQETDDLEQILSFLVFGDGCAAGLVTSEPAGLCLERFHTLVMDGDAGLITWSIGDSGFDMVLSGRVPGAIARALEARAGEVLGGRAPRSIADWAVHPGGRSVLDAVERAFELPAVALAHSRAVLRDYGNMSSATVLFVLARLLDEPKEPDGPGCALAFGPGLTAETLLFQRMAS